MKDDSNTVIQEDKVLSHAHRDQAKIYDIKQIQRLIKSY